MCTVSMVGDHYKDIFQPKPWFPQPGQTFPVAPVSRHEFDELKRQVEEMKSLLKRAKEYDERNDEPHCEVEEKMEVLRMVAKLVGVDLSDVIGPSKASA